MFIPLNMVKQPILGNLIRDFVLQGTDFDVSNSSIEKQCEQVLLQLENKTAVITYSELHEEFNICPLEKFNNNPL
ncbi:MAG: hypothetical protein ACI87J_001968 [Colwellia sp.]|jgi:uncharacterized protein YheU (UPF0270 family)